jgi:hypothetical protein
MFLASLAFRLLSSVNYNPMLAVQLVYLSVFVRRDVGTFYLAMVEGYKLADLMWWMPVMGL